MKRDDSTAFAPKYSRSRAVIDEVGPSIDSDHALSYSAQRRNEPQTPGNPSALWFWAIDNDAATNPAVAHVVDRRAIPAATAPVTPSVAAHIRAALRRWWERLWMDEMTAYLSKAADEADLGYRIRLWDQGERNGRVRHR